jgi:tetratricopeptide (TPR) repeat protein
VQFTRGHRGEAERLALQARDESGSQGDRWAQGMMTVLLASIRLWQGRAVEAVERASEARRLFEDLGDVWGQCRAFGPLSRALLITGELEEARRVVEAAFAVSELLPEADAPAFPAVMAAGVEVHAGDGEAAISALAGANLALEDRSPSPGVRVGEEELAHLFGLALVQTGRARRAVVELEDALPRMRDVGPRAAGLAALALAQSATGDTAAARQRAAEVAALPGGTYLDLATALVAHACAAARDGDRDDAVRALDEASSLLEATDDVVTPGVVALARARVLGALADPAAEAALGEARRRFDAVGLPAKGWDVALLDATGAVDGRPG